MNHRYSANFISLADLYLAYRKAKVEAYYENTHFNAIAFTQYEERLQTNLNALLVKLHSIESTWAKHAAKLGSWTYMPKQLADFDTQRDEVFYRALDPLEEWAQRSFGQNHKRLSASYRLVIKPTVDFQVISALWILKVGHIFEAKLDPRYSFGNRLRRKARRNRPISHMPRELNSDCLGLFTPYFSAYRNWREGGLASMKDTLRDGGRVLAVTMDLQRFYHSVTPEFMLDPRFIANLELDLSPDEMAFTADLLLALRSWYVTTPDYEIRPEGGLPVGLSASKIISNVLLAEFDRHVVASLGPVYYGRYVDDIFLVLRGIEGISSGNQFVSWLAKKLSPIVQHKKADDSITHSLKISLPYAKSSDLIFAGPKLKIFNLHGDHGLDLVMHIGEQIRRQSSEHRLLPELPANGLEMATRALLATPDASLEADALRKADVVSIRRLGFSLLLRDAEAYSRDLRRSDWSRTRNEFYELARRHLLTPRGIFEFSSYLHRVLALMVCCEDYLAANSFLTQFKQVMEMLADTTTAGTRDRQKYQCSLSYFADAFGQAAMQASTVRRFKISREFVRLLKAIATIDNRIPVAATVASVRRLSELILRSDWGRRAYRDYWYYSHTSRAKGPSVPRSFAVRRVLRLGAIRRFRELADLRVPHWPALAFPTRPLSVAEIGLIAPATLSNQTELENAIWALRGARARSAIAVGFELPGGASGLDVLEVPIEQRSDTVIALTSLMTTDRQWKGAATGRPDWSLRRYTALRGLLNRILQEEHRPGIIILPECSTPLRWALGIAYKLAQNSVSLIAGIEYRQFGAKLRNDCLISLVTRWPGYLTNLVRLQPKLMPSHEEKRELKKIGKELYVPTQNSKNLPIYVHGNLCFGVLLCSDLTNIENRTRFQGEVDILFVLEWNRDINTFGFLVESTAHDLHTFVVQVNNRAYGDSRIRTPFRSEYMRDLVRVKGGISDYYVIANIDWHDLRAFQRKARYNPSSSFKPLPIGFQMSARRRNDG